MAQAGGAVLELDGIGKTFDTPTGPVEVLSGVTLTVRAGDFVMLTGPSGSGKTTLLSIAGLMATPTSGRVRLDGEPVATHRERQRCRLRGQYIGFVFQRFHLLPHRSLIDNVVFRFRYLPHDPDEARGRARAVLEDVGLAGQADRPARLLSAGEMQRAAIARAIVHPPRILLADEPTGNLDRAAAGVVMDCFDRLRHRGMTVLMATHNEALLAPGMRHVRCVIGTLEEIACAPVS